MRLSVVSTLYRSESLLADFHERVSAQARALAGDGNYELVLVNDGSPDRSLEVALAIGRQDPRVRVVDLSRNFGHHKAILCGLEHARGDLVFLIDSDLEDPPEVLSEFHARMRATGADVVYGYQAEARAGAFNRIAGAAFYRLFNALTDHPIPPNVRTIRLMSRRYLEALLAHRDRQMGSIAGLWARTGFEQLGLPVDRCYKGWTTYGFKDRLGCFVRGIVGASTRPLELPGWIGLAILAASGAVLAWILGRALVLGAVPDPWTVLLASVWFLGGLGLGCIGLVALYVGVIVEETKPRPRTIVRRVYGPSETSIRVSIDDDQEAAGRGTAA